MKALVAGGAGFIGSHLIDALLSEGHEAVCVDNLSLGTRDNISHLWGKEGFRFYEFDLCDTARLENVLEEEGIDYVFQLAANSDIQASAHSPHIEYRNTYTSTYSLLEAMRKHNVKKLFFASTSAVYGDKTDVLLDENTPGLGPISYYGAAKLGCEALISAYSHMNDMESLVFRFPNVVGPRLTHGVIYDFIAKLKNNPQELQILGDGRQTKPYIYVQDLVDAILYFYEKSEKGVTLYNIGVDGSTSVNTIADIVCEEMGLTNVRYSYTGGAVGWKGDVPRFQYCLDKVHSAGFRASRSSDQAVRETVQRNLI